MVQNVFVRILLGATVCSKYFKSKNFSYLAFKKKGFRRATNLALHSRVIDGNFYFQHKWHFHFRALKINFFWAEFHVSGPFNTKKQDKSEKMSVDAAVDRNFCHAYSLDHKT
jgi:hypothetical protein